MNIIDLLEEVGLTPKRKAVTKGGEYGSPCPICKDGVDCFLSWPNQVNNTGVLNGGRFYCRKCGKSGDAITLLKELYGLSYLEACHRLSIKPAEYRHGDTPHQAKTLTLPVFAESPSEKWKDRAGSYVEWCSKQLLSDPVACSMVTQRGFTRDSIARFRLGFLSGDLYRERERWGLFTELKDDGAPRRLWLPKGFVIPTFSNDGTVAKVKVRRTDFVEGDKYGKYVEIPGSKKCPSIYGDTTLDRGVIIESEFDALLVQQEAGDLCYCIALGGSTKPIDRETYDLLRRTPTLFFCPDFDDAGGAAWLHWKSMFASLNLMLTPSEKSAGDLFLAGVSLRAWIQANIEKLASRR